MAGPFTGHALHSRGRVQRNWFELMSGYLHWKVVPPDYNNPFKTPVADKVLRELTHKRAALMRVCKLKCVCDGYEMMSFDNLEDPNIFTEHPCISAMGTSAVLDYVSRSEVHDDIQQQLDRIETAMREFLHERYEANSQREIDWDEDVTIKEFRRRRAGKKIRVASAAGGYVVRYESSRGL